MSETPDPHAADKLEVELARLLAPGRAGGAHALDRLRSDAARARPASDDGARVYPPPRDAAGKPIVADAVATVHEATLRRLAATAPPPAAPAPAAGQGVKHDAGKLRLDLLPTDALEAVARILTHGAAKYGDRNWEAGMSWRRLDAALERHLFAWRRGEERDAESGQPHLAHAACCVLLLLAYAERGVGLDDRVAAERRRAP